LTSKEFLDNCLCLDIETSGSETIYHLGAVRGDVTFERKGRFDLPSALKELDSLAEPAQYILGHNLLGHEPIFRIARTVWHRRLDRIEKITVLAMVQRRVEDSGQEYRDRCKCEQWEVPVVEVVYMGKR